MNLEHLTTFCSLEENRRSLNTPWSEGAYSYASDGRVIIRIPRLADVPERDSAPKNLDQQLFKGFPLAFPFSSITEPVSADYNKCTKCYGSGERTCSECGTTHTCDQCKGNGQLASTTKIGTQLFNTHNLRLISQLCEIQWQLKSSENRIYFEFNGGDGLISSTSEEKP